VNDGTTKKQSFPKLAVVEEILRENFGEGYITINSKLISEVTRRLKYSLEKFQSEFKPDKIIKLVGDPEISVMLKV
jgi:hypothetical protein